MSEKELIKKIFELKKLEMFDEAIKILYDLLETDPHSESIKKVFIEVLFEHGCYLNDEWTADYEKAIRNFKKVIELEPNNYQAWYNLGISYFKLNRSNEALDAYKRTIEIKPDYMYCYYSIGLLYETNLNDLETALKYYEKALSYNENFTYALQALRDVRQKLEILKLQCPIDLPLESKGQNICNNCGNINRENAKFCDKCGERM